MANDTNAALLGQCVAASFAHLSDGHGGTAISELVPNQQQQYLATRTDNTLQKAERRRRRQEAEARLPPEGRAAKAAKAAKAREALLGETDFFSSELSIQTVPLQLYRQIPWYSLEPIPATRI
jgi:hypothetical protein